MPAFEIEMPMPGRRPHWTELADEGLICGLGAEDLAELHGRHLSFETPTGALVIRDTWGDMADLIVSEVVLSG